MSLILTMYYGQLIIGFVCGAGIALCSNYLIKNKNVKKNGKKCTK
jgi:LPS O-antigen subunit length determinant protein (WzzB/FepE family)